MMNLKLKVRTLIPLLLLATIALQSCAPAVADATAVARATATKGEIPTWTPRLEDLNTLPTATAPAPIKITPSVTQTQVDATPRVPTPKAVSVTIVGGNLFVHRGPSLYHNFIGVLYDGEVVLATGRDRISRWLRVEVPSNPGVEGWITTETAYTKVNGDISKLPFIETEPASPAFIRNCTKTTIVILPEDVQLLDKYNKPYNEEQFIVGRHQVIDLDFPGTARLEDIELSEGKTVDIIYDGTGEKSKCE
jgi:hypothetical protein